MRGPSGEITGPPKENNTTDKNQTARKAKTEHTHRERERDTTHRRTVTSIVLFAFLPSLLPHCPVRLPPQGGGTKPGLPSPRQGGKKGCNRRNPPPPPQQPHFLNCFGHGDLDRLTLGCLVRDGEQQKEKNQPWWCSP